VLGHGTMMNIATPETAHTAKNQIRLLIHS
jgi:hypothetical protein